MAVTDQDIINAIRAIRKELSRLKEAWDGNRLDKVRYHADRAGGEVALLKEAAGRALRERKHSD